jgi:hypothetical protein
VMVTSDRSLVLPRCTQRLGADRSQAKELRGRRAR